MIDHQFGEREPRCDSRREPMRSGRDRVLVSGHQRAHHPHRHPPLSVAFLPPPTAWSWRSGAGAADLELEVSCAATAEFSVTPLTKVPSSVLVADLGSVQRRGVALPGAWRRVCSPTTDEIARQRPWAAAVPRPVA